MVKKFEIFFLMLFLSIVIDYFVKETRISSVVIVVMEGIAYYYIDRSRLQKYPIIKMLLLIFGVIMAIISMEYPLPSFSIKKYAMFVTIFALIVIQRIRAFPNESK